MTNQLNNLKQLILLSIFLVSFLVFNLYSTENKIILPQINPVNASPLIDDEIEPYCEGINFRRSQQMNLENIEKIDINFINQTKWYRNMFSAIEESQVFIFENRKSRFDAKISVSYSNGVNCIFSGKVRLSGDFQDHIRTTDLSATLDIQLENGNIDNIVNFKLFLPETRRNDTELALTVIMENLGFLVPRTIKVKSSIDNQKEIEYIFQEKIAKEFIENNNLRESVLLETSEEFFWEKRILVDSNLPILFGKFLNDNWVNRTVFNQTISLKGLNQLNMIIFQSNGFYLKYDYINNLDLLLFDTAMYALDGHHGLAIHNRKFYFDNFSNKLLPIYYDADSQLSLRETSVTPCSNELVKEYEKVACYNYFSYGASLLLEKIDFNIDSLYEELVSKKANISKNEFQKIVEKFIFNLDKISAIDSKNFNDSQDGLSIYKTNYLKDVENDNYGFYFINQNDQLIKYCNFGLQDCYLEKIQNNYQLKNMVEVENIQYFLLGSFNLENSVEENYINVINIDEEIQIKEFNGPVEINFDYTKRIIYIFLEDNEKILFQGPGALIDWDIVIQDSKNRELTKFRQDENSLTGCVTFLNLRLENITVASKDSFCEDAVNFINVTGKLNKVNRVNSNFDGVDADFSNLEIGKVEIFNSGNDCFDVSYSKVKISEVNLDNCNDKGISVGEKSDVSIDFLNGYQINTVVAVKDSSKVIINNFRGDDANVCIAMYRKKQEFGPSYLKINSYNCLSINSNFIQDGQEVEIEK